MIMRGKLAELLLMNQYYLEDMNSLLKSNIPWIKTSQVYQSMMALSNVCKENINEITDQSSGGIICFKDP